MKYFDFQGTKLSRLGFGFMRLPVLNDDQSQVDYEQVEKMFLEAYGSGVNYYDTAYPYHNGFSEKTLGKILTNNGLHGKVNVATKLFTLGIDRPGFDPKAMVAEQLSRLETDHIEFYLIHGLHGNQWDYLCEHFDMKNYLRSLKAQGVIGHIGFSFHDNLEAFKKIIDSFEWDFAQIQYNYLDNKLQAGDEGLAYARAKGIPVQVMEPVKGGNLIFPDYPAIEDIKARHGIVGMTNAELAFAYVYSRPGFGVVLSGMSNIEQVRDNVHIADKWGSGIWTPDMEGAVEDIRELIAHSEGIPCTGCRYCTAGCPAKIPIPMAFSLYNEGKKYRNPGAQKRNYDRSCRVIRDCTECGQCMDACPQHLEIPALLKEVRAYLER